MKVHITWIEQEDTHEIYLRKNDLLLFLIKMGEHGCNINQVIKEIEKLGYEK